MLARQVRQQKAHADLRAIWRTYTDSFADNQEEIKNRFLHTLTKDADKIHVSEFSAALDMLDSLGADVKPLIELYAKQHSDEFSKMEPTPLITRQISFVPLRQRLIELNTRQSALSLDEVTERILVNQSWTRSDIEYLASLSVEDMRQWMLSSPDDLPGKIQGGLLLFGKSATSSNVDTQRYQQIYDTTVSALRSIATTSELNKRRIKDIYEIREDI